MKVSIKDIAKRWYKRSMNMIIHILFTIQYFFSPHRILLNSWIKVGVFHTMNRNLGDDINIPLIEGLTGRKVSLKNNLWSSHSNVLCIGSIIDKLGDRKSIIWGSGVLDGNSSISYSPQKVYAVRGRYSREYLMRFGIECPEIYGDPALLMPLIFTPKIKKTNRIGIIPHYSDLESPVVNKFLRENGDVTLIKFANYTSWKDVICQMCSCKAIISSSLHGLILSDAFGIPNVRILLSNKIGGGDFKFMDYYSGVNRKWVPPINCLETINRSIIDAALKEYVPIVFDPKPLLRAFPLKLSDKFLSLICSENAKG